MCSRILTNLSRCGILILLKGSSFNCRVNILAEKEPGSVTDNGNETFNIVSILFGIMLKVFLLGKSN